MSKVLLKDIVIPKGTVFEAAPVKTERVSDDHFGVDFGLSKNTSGYIEYCVDEDFANETDEWFAELR